MEKTSGTCRTLRVHCSNQSEIDSMFKSWIIKLSLLSLCLLPACMFGYNVKGLLTDKDGNRIQYANIVAMSRADSSFVKGTVTDEEGVFELDLQEGKYIVKLSCISFKTAYKDIYLDEKGVDMGMVTMEEDARLLNEVVVKGNRPTVKRNATGFIVTVDHSKQLQNKTLDRILNASPGIYMDRLGSISINGRSGVTVVVNDKTMNLTGDQLISYMNSIQGSDLKSIEIISNPTSNYDAEGSGGVIRINTKTRRNQGLAGYVSSAFAHSRKPRFDESVGLNYTLGNVTLYSNYTFYREKSASEKHATEWLNSGERYETSEYHRKTINNHAYRVGLDWQPSDKHFLGFEYNGQTRSDRNSGQTEVLTYINDAYDGRVATDNPIKNRPYNNLYNLNYIWKIDTLGQQLKVIADYSDVNNSHRNRYGYYNKNYDAKETFLGTQNRRQDLSESIDIYSAQIDYENPFRTKEWKLGAGAKYNKVKTDYQTSFFNWQNESDTPIEDLTYKDHFNYDEERYSVYVNAAYSGRKIEANVGLRGEYTKTEGVSHVSGEVNEDDYMKLFPSAFLYYKPNNIHGVMVYYGMRIRRPNYSLVNPFTYYSNEVSLTRGNPNLKPDISNVIELTYVLRNKYYFSLRASLTDDVMKGYTYTEDGKTVKTYGNWDKMNYYYLNTYIPFDWGMWNSSFLLNVGILETKADGKDKSTFNLEMEWQNYFRILENLGCEARFAYSPPFKMVYEENRRHFAKLDINFDYSFLKDKAMLSAGVDDIFNSSGKRHTVSCYEEVKTDGVLYPAFSGRTYRISLKFNFNAGGKVNRRGKDKSNTEEMERL